jgi:RecB family endonuclease NucS
MVAAQAEPPLSDDSPGPSLSLERDLERALRANPGQIEPGLCITDGGVQANVPSGRIDILAEDAAGRQVVIELKAVRAPRDAVAQVLAYMGDIQAETGRAVRGVLIAPDFDARAISAARMVPALVLRRFSFQFSFETVDPAP